MPKKNYTKAGAKRAIMSCETKIRKVFEDGHMRAGAFVKLMDEFKRLKRSIK